MRFFRGQDVLCLSLLVVTVVEFVSGQPPGSKLKIKSPERLVAELDHRDSLFGQPPYGASIEQQVYYSHEDLCGFEYDASQLKSPFILLIDRGGCTFVQKIRNAQRLGASAAIIADNRCLCSDANCDSGGGTCETSEPIMADDGSGLDISIPSMLIFKTDADRLIQELKNNTEIMMEMSYNLPTPDDRVEYDLFTTPTDGVSKSFLSHWKPMAKALGTKAYFTPHMYIYDGIRTHCVGTDGENVCFNLCTNAGRYCQTDPDNDLDRGISGADVVKESLRRICVWNKYGEDGVGEKWWDYIIEFENSCSPPDYFTNEECITNAYERAGVDGDAITRCMVDSGGLEEDRPNSLLDGAITTQSEKGVVVLPTVFVNTVALRGALTPEALFHAICAGFAEGSAPEVCSRCARCQWDLTACVESNVCARTGGGGTLGSGTSTTGGESTIGNSFGNIDSSLSGNGSNPSNGGSSTSGNNAGGSGFSSENTNNSNGGGITSGNTVGDTIGEGTNMYGGGSAATSQQANGYSNWEPNEEVDDPMMLGLNMLSGLLESFGGSEICGLNFEQLAEATTGGNTDLLDSIELDEQCNSSQEQQFLGTLEKFESCSGWDIKEVIETLPSAMVGAAMRCIMKAMTLADDEAFAETIFTECAEVVLDDNPLGNALKRIILEPDKNCGCLESLSELPECELDVWPIPIFGSGLKSWSCLLTTLGCGFLQPICDSEVAGLAACLPEEKSNGELCQAANCEDSILLSLPPPLAGMPIPDACRLSNPSVVAGYELYVKQCVKDIGFWDIHEPSSNYVDPPSPSDTVSGMDDSVQEEESTTSAFDEELQQEEEKEVLDREKVEQEYAIQSPSTVIEEETTTSESTPFSGFVNGVITGAVAAAAVAVSAALLVYFKKKSSVHNGPGGGNDKRGLYTSIELT